MANEPTKKKGGLMSLLFTEEVPVETKKVKAVEPIPALTLASTGVEQFDQNVYAQFMKLIEENNMEGYDYFEFRNAIENMKAVIPGEAERFKAAYAAVASLVKVDKLILSIDFYLSKIDAKKKEFDEYVTSVVAQKVTGKEEQAKSLDEKIIKTNEAIAKLNEDIGKLQEERTKLLNESVAEKAKIETVRNGFVSTYNKVVAEINSDKTKIKTYLGEGK